MQIVIKTADQDIHVTKDVEYVIIYTDTGSATVVAHRVAPDVYELSVAGDKDFNAVLDRVIQKRGPAIRHLTREGLQSV